MTHRKSRHLYFVTFPGQPEQEVSFEAWCKAERAAGFSAPEGHAATGGFSGRGISGRIEFERISDTIIPDEPGDDRRHPQVQLTPPGSDESVGIDIGLAPLITALWEAGFTTITCCQDLGESIGKLNARKAAYWKGWVLLELPAADAKRLTEQAAARRFPMHWAREDAWEVSIPVVMLGSRAVFTGIVQVHFPVAQLEDLTAAIPGFRGRPE
jgi:hypothetical protein